MGVTLTWSVCQQISASLVHTSQHDEVDGMNDANSRSACGWLLDSLLHHQHFLDAGPSHQPAKWAVKPRWLSAAKVLPRSRPLSALEYRLGTQVVMHMRFGLADLYSLLLASSPLAKVYSNGKHPSRVRLPCDHESMMVLVRQAAHHPYRRGLPVWQAARCSLALASYLLPSQHPLR